jgi:DHA1 family bicyclomycin/chloramphenicol resistance-like MFS transporter
MSTNGTEEPKRISSAKITFILGSLMAFGPLSIDMYLPGLPDIGRELNSDAGTIQYTLSFFLIGMAAGQTFYGPISDRFGRKLPLVFGCALYIIASLCCALSTSAVNLIALRFIQAVGCCAGMVLTNSIVRDLFDARDSARMYSMLFLVTGLAPITAPFIGGYLVLYSDWRMIFWVLTIFGCICLLMVIFFLPETLPADRRTSGGLDKVIVNYGRMLATRSFVGYALCGGFTAGMMFAYISGSPFVFIELYGVAPHHYGWLFGLNALGLVCASQLNRLLLRRYNNIAIMRTMLWVIAASGLVLVLVALTGSGGLIGLMIPIFICIGSIALVGANAVALALAPYKKSAGTASAMLGTLQLAMGAGSGTLIGILHTGTAMPMAGIIGLCALAALITFYTMTEREPRRPSSAG